jgi:beta-lactamase class A
MNRLSSSLQEYVTGRPQRATLFVDLKTTQPAFEHLADEPMPAASVMKLPLAMALYNSDIDLTERISITNLPYSRYCSIWEAFQHTSDVSVAELCHMMMIVSDNAASAYLADRVGTPAVNVLLRDIGCSSHANMVSGFAESEMRRWYDNILTARDCGLLLREIAVNPRYARLRHAMVHNIRNNRLGSSLPDQVQIAHKTGSLKGVANDVALITEGSPATSPIEYILVCLAADEPDTAAINAAQAALSLQVYEAVIAAHPRAAPQHRIYLHESGTPF